MVSLPNFVENFYKETEVQKTENFDNRHSIRYIISRELTKFEILGRGEGKRAKLASFRGAFKRDYALWGGVPAGHKSYVAFILC